MGGIGQRARVAALADVQTDIPDEAEQRGDDRGDEQTDLECDPGRPVELVAHFVREAL
ncbi:Uncharacterised protein [Mycobacteroides abscessus subsp. abscessus]|nr:Uncharacterised protein [Mycobacteroides abscessus subsp. abscessus]